MTLTIERHTRALFVRLPMIEAWIERRSWWARPAAWRDGQDWHMEAGPLSVALARRKHTAGSPMAPRAAGAKPST